MLCVVERSYNSLFSPIQFNALRVKVYFSSIPHLSIYCCEKLGIYLILHT
jgi:hypothetical protein